MHPATRARIAAIVLVAAAVALWAMGQPGPAVVLFAVAAGVALIVTDRAVTHETAAALAAGPDAAITDAIDAMGLEGRGIVAPWRGGAILFAPARDVEPADVPTFDGTTRVVQRAPAVGMFLTAPGQGLLDAVIAFYGPPAGGVEGAAATLKRALPALGVADRVHVESGPRIRITYRLLIPTTTDATRAWAGIGGDPVASLTGLVLCLATQRAWRLAAQTEVEGGVRVEWE